MVGDTVDASVVSFLLGSAGAGDAVAFGAGLLAASLASANRAQATASGGRRTRRTKDADVVQIGHAVRAAAAGQSLPDPELQRRLVLAASASRPQALLVSEATVEPHVDHGFAKTGARDRAQEVRCGYAQGLADSAAEPLVAPGLAPAAASLAASGPAPTCRRTSRATP
jgi:hypothetical protein